MHYNKAGSTRGARAAVAVGAFMRRGLIFLLAHSLFLSLAICLFAAV